VVRHSLRTAVVWSWLARVLVVKVAVADQVFNEDGDSCVAYAFVMPSPAGSRAQSCPTRQALRRFT
jgi:hypothetical protein